MRLHPWKQVCKTTPIIPKCAESARAEYSVRETCQEIIFFWVKFRGFYKFSGEVISVVFPARPVSNPWPPRKININF